MTALCVALCAAFGSAFCTPRCATAASVETARVGLQGPTIWTELDGRPLAALREHLGGSVRIDAVSTASLFDDARRGRAPEADLLFAVDVETCGLFAERGRLAAAPERDGIGLSPFGRDPEGRFVVTFARPWVVAHSAAAFENESPVERYGDLLDARWTDRLAIPEPAAAPALWTEWIRANLGPQSRLRHAFAWLTTLDARVGTYGADVGAVASALRAGDVDLAVLPLDRALLLRESGGFDFVVPKPRVAWAGLAQAVVAGRRGDRAAVLAVHERLLAPELCAALAATGVVPCPRVGADPVALPAWLADARDAALAVRAHPLRVEEWFQRWRDRVRGKGRTAETIDVALDFVFGVLFLVFLAVVYTRTRSTEG